MMKTITPENAALYELVINVSAQVPVIDRAL
jgi:hypothetical protein